MSSVFLRVLCATFFWSTKSTKKHEVHEVILARKEKRKKENGVICITPFLVNELLISLLFNQLDCQPSAALHHLGDVHSGFIAFTKGDGCI